MDMKLGVLASNENEAQPNTARVDNLVELIKKAICDEHTATYQYCIAKHIARGAGYCDVVPEYEQHAKDEEGHAQAWLDRLEQCGIMFTYDMVELATKGNPWTPIKTSNIKEQLGILIKAEEDAAAFYAKIVEVAREEKDWITERMAKEYMADETEHATDLKRIYEQFN